MSHKSHLIAGSYYRWKISVYVFFHFCQLSSCPLEKQQYLIINGVYILHIYMCVCVCVLPKSLLENAAICKVGVCVLYITYGKALHRKTE